MKVCCITNDVESLSINGDVFDDIAQKVQNEALPALLRLYAKYDVKATFYCLASFAMEYPYIVEQIKGQGHEVACHGLVHDKDMAFDVMTCDNQILHLLEAKHILESISCDEVVSFRAPALRVNGNTPMALKLAGFKVDSSIAPQRLDMFMSLGSKAKLQWLGAPRSLYISAADNLARRGESGITEVPVSAVGLPYIGTLMRISPLLTKLVRYFLYLETRSQGNNKVICFLYHPSEAVSENEQQTMVKRRSSNFLSFFLRDILRTKLKKRNLGPQSLNLLEKELAFWRHKGYVFKTVKELL